ncbi:hypothetical protein N7V09_17000 [Shewanella seohaensis]|uniref:hypothetical protein n=1 Tax=Shewanella seohaensis TaxID=755175 RepID=UPI0021C706F8|nr:hypothetical protein [Shewanella seohaensis]UXM81429.1 hypothetical protein N7V09_17000 [Shewanella seohaensis]
MENPFFTALEQQGFSADTLASQTNSVLMPFMHYLNNSIKALENKEVRCEWKPVARNRYRLKPDKSIWQLLPVSEIEVVVGKEGWFEILTVDGEVPDADFDRMKTIRFSKVKAKDDERRISPMVDITPRSISCIYPNLN